MKLATRGFWLALSFLAVWLALGDMSNGIRNVAIIVFWLIVLIEMLVISTLIWAFFTKKDLQIEVRENFFKGYLLSERSLLQIIILISLVSIDEVVLGTTLVVFQILILLLRQYLLKYRATSG